jgi:hypothetical protein
VTDRPQHDKCINFATYARLTLVATVVLKRAPVRPQPSPKMLKSNLEVMSYKPIPVAALRSGSAAARLLGLWVRIPPAACLSVSCECCVLSGRGLCDGLVTRPEESYRMWCV